MRLTDIDRSATQTPGGWLHRVAVPVKLLALVAVIATAIISWNLWVLASLAAVLIALGLSARLRPGLLLGLAAYPLIFSALLVITLQPGWTLSALIVLKAFCTALGAVCLILSTPYPRVFALTGRVLPQLLNDSLLMTYRCLFILAANISELLVALRLRADLSWRHPLTFLRCTGDALGTLVAQALDLAEQDYEVLNLRGYDGSLRIDTKERK